MATTYGERRDALTQLQVTLKTCRSQVSQCIVILTTAKDQLDGLPTQLKTLLEDINSDKGQGTIAYQVMGSEAEILLAEVFALSTQVDEKVKALQSAGEV